MRLGKYSSVLFAPGVIATTFLAGCIIVGTGSSGNDNSGGVGGGFDTTSGSGVGGEPEITTGNGTTTTTPTTTSSGTLCIGVNGPGLVSDCDKLNIAPMNGASSNCGTAMNEPPPGYGTCKHAFDIFTSGPATDLKNCLSRIGVQNRCDEKLVETCVGDMYKSTCRDDPQFAQSCASIASNCAANKQGSIDQPRCVEDLTPLKQPSIDKFFDCLDVELPKAGATCESAYETCYELLLQF